MNGQLESPADAAARQGRGMRAIAALLMVGGVWMVAPVLLFFAFFGDHRGGGPDPRDTLLFVWLVISSAVVLGALALGLGGRRQRPVVFAITVILGLLWLAWSALGIFRVAQRWAALAGAPAAAVATRC
jgi:hypothetical protein